MRVTPTGSYRRETDRRAAAGSDRRCRLRSRGVEPAGTYSGPLHHSGRATVGNACGDPDAGSYRRDQLNASCHSSPGPPGRFRARTQRSPSAGCHVAQ